MNFTALGRALLWGVVGVLAVMAGIFAIDRYRHYDPVELQSYELPQGIATEVQNTLSRALSQGDILPPLGRVTQLPNGSLLVAAPASVQAGVRNVLRDIGKTKPSPTPTIGFDVWIVRGSISDSNDYSSELAEIAPAMDGIRNSLGPLRLELLERLSTVARAGQGRAEVQGTTSRVSIQASLRKDDQDEPSIASTVQINVQGATFRASLDASIESQPGELLVIGQSALGGQPGAPEAPGTQVYYILRATL